MVESNSDHCLGPASTTERCNTHACPAPLGKYLIDNVQRSAIHEVQKVIYLWLYMLNVSKTHRKGISWIWQTTSQNMVQCWRQRHLSEF